MKWLEYLKRINKYEELFEYQKEACDLIDDGYNVVVSAPTGSGKTFVAEYGIVYGVKKLKKKVVYVAPLRSLVYEKLVDFSKFKDLNIDVVAVTGELWVYEKDIELADVIMTTIEKLNSIIRHEPRFWSTVGVLIVDEIHMISENGRGAILEQLLTEARENGIQIVGLSATIGNLEELAHWLDAELVVSDERKVKLEYGVFYRGVLEWSDGRKEYTECDWIRALVLPVVEEGKNVLIFVSSRREAESLARKIARLMPRNREIEIKHTDLARLVAYGVAYHHAGMSKDRRMYVENLFRDRKIKVLVSTTTLAMGVNLPAYRVIIKGIMKYDSSGYRYYTINEIRQMMGRAGRPKYDKEGQAIIVVMSKHLVDLVKRKYLRRVSQSLYSRLYSELDEVILRYIVYKEASTIDDIYEFLRKTFAYYLNSKHVIDVESIVMNLANNVMVVLEDGLIKPTEFGRTVAELCISIPTAILIKKNFDTIRRMTDFLSMIVSVREVMKVSVSKDEIESLRRLSIMYPEPSFKVTDESSYYELLKAYLILTDWVNGVSKSTILSKYNIAQRDLDEMITGATWIAHAIYRIGKVYGGDEVAEQLKKLRDRVEYGATEEMLDIMMIDGVTRSDALLLVRRGFKSRHDLFGLTPRDLVKRKIPTKIVSKIFGIKVEKLKNIDKHMMIDNWVGG